MTNRYDEAAEAEAERQRTEPRRGAPKRFPAAPAFR